MLKRMCATAVILCAMASLSAEAEKLKIGVFDQRAAGGQGASVQGLLRGLNQLDYAAERITDLQLLTLLQYDIIYLSDMHSPGRVHVDWRQTLTSFVESGGSVLQTWHHHILGAVGVGVRRIYGSRRMHVVGGHSAVAGLSDFDALFKDHIVERVGPRGTVIVKNDADDPVAVAGKLGKGKVISTGLALGIPNGRTSAAPRGPESKLLKSFLAWLTPDVPRADRLAQALKSPRLEVSPFEALTAAGFDALFTARVGYRETGDIEVECPGAEIRSDKSSVKGGLRSFLVTIHTKPGKESHHEYSIHAKVGNILLKEEFKVTAIYGKPFENEIRGVWLHVRPDRRPKVVMPELKKLGINMAILRIAGGTAAFYASKVQPDIQDPLAPDGDWLAEAVEHAHANGVEIHPYVNNCVVEGRTSEQSLKRLRSEGRLQEGPDGRPIDWFCPSQAINCDAIERPMIEIVTRYEVDGIQYDFIRYPNSSGCFCPKCRARFEKERGKPVVNWPADVIDGPRKAEWIEYRCGRISALVQRISTHIRRVAPEVKISAAVFRDWPTCRKSVGQDWVRWCKEGWLDFVVPMNYTLDDDLFAERAAAHRAAVPEGFPILEGIGIHSSAGAMSDPAQLAAQIAIARRAGAAGFVGFCYTPKQTSDLFAPIKDWIERE